MGGGFSKGGGADATAAEANAGRLASYIPACLLPASIDEHEQQQQPQPEQATSTASAPSSAGSILLRALWRKKQQEESTPRSDTSSSTIVTLSPAPLSSPVAPAAAAAPPRPFNRTDLLLRGLVRQTVVKVPGDIGGGACPPQPFAIDACVGCDIYVLEATAQVTIDDCVDCRIVLGPCAGSLFLRDSSKCVVMAACQQYRTRGCTDLDVRLYAATAPSIESSHSIRFGCYTCAYTSLAAQFAAAGLDPKGDNRWWDVYDFTPSAAIAVDDDGGTKPHFSIMAGDATHAPDVKPLPSEIASQIGYSAHPALSIVPLTSPPGQ